MAPNNEHLHVFHAHNGINKDQMCSASDGVKLSCLSYGLWLRLRHGIELVVTFHSRQNYDNNKAVGTSFTSKLWLRQSCLFIS